MSHFRRRLRLRLRLRLLLHLALFLLSYPISPASSQNNTSPCPLDFTVLRNLVVNSTAASNRAVPSSQTCQYIRQGLRLVESHYLQLTNSFLPPLNSSESCWVAYQSLIDESIPNFDIRSRCGFQTSWISQGCMNITTKSQFESLIPNSTLNDVVSSCNTSLENNSPCAACTASLSRLQALYLTGSATGNVTDCQAYPSIYAAAFANRYGPTDKGTAKCLFLLDFITTGTNNNSNRSGDKSHKVLIVGGSIVGGLIFLAISAVGCWFFAKRKKLYDRRKRNEKIGRDVEMRLDTGLEAIRQSTTLVKYTFDEIKKATRKFSRDYIVGRGGYGNVYRGELPDGTEVALKRFKNCSALGDANFVHEVEVIASVRHVNLVALRGYCIATTPFEGHQRIIVCDLMKNGSLHDHLFGSNGERRLSWPIRQKIAVGTARGLAYLHYGAQPGIIHRDIKASNILLDERFEAKVGDFGLAKFTPEGMTHLSTRVAGTLGYIAPEYALYGQLTERSDVYSFGVVLLELLSGRKALMPSDDDGQPLLVTDWAWSLVRNGAALDVLEDGIPELGAQDVMEKYVLIAVLCSHPQLYARPTMDQVVKMLETDLSIPTIPERPVSIVANMDEIERSANSSGQLSSHAGCQRYTFENDRASGSKDDGSSSDSRIVELL